MLHIRELSDLHLEFYYDLYDAGVDRAISEIKKILPPMPIDKKAVLIVAGDLATAVRAGRIVTFFEQVVPRFKHVIYVLGNHEYYGCRFNEAEDKIFDALSSSKIDLSKLTVAGAVPKLIKIKDITFMCGTLWTDYGNGNPEIAAAIKRCITDHRVIRDDNDVGVPPASFAQIFSATIAKFEEWLNGSDNTKTVMVTHHMPSYQAVDPQYMMDPNSRLLNAAFASDLDEFIIKHRPKFWFFGHTHTSYTGIIGDTTLMCNPLGYPNEGRQFDGSFKNAKVYSL